MATKLKSLTDQQWAEMREYRDNIFDLYYRSGSLSLTDRKQTEQAISACYGYIGHDAPICLWVRGPLELLIAGHVIALHLSHLGTKLGLDLWEQLRDQLRDHLQPKLGTQLRDQLRDQLGGEFQGPVRAELGFQLWDQLRAQLGDQLRDQLRDQLEDQLEDQLRAELRDQLEDQLEDQLGAELREQLWDQLGAVVFWHWFLGYEYYLKFINQIVPVPASQLSEASLDAWINANRSLWMPLKGVAIISDYSVDMHTDRQWRLHNESGPAWAWADGFEIYALDGVRVPKWVIMEPPNPQRVLQELVNAEQRRVAFAYMGWEFAIEALSLQALDEHENPHMGTLYALPDTLIGQANLLLAKNGSPHPNGEYQMYGLLCSPDARTVEEAQASLAGLSVEEMIELEGRT